MRGLSGSPGVAIRDSDSSVRPSEVVTASITVYHAGLECAAVSTLHFATSNV